MKRKNIALTLLAAMVLTAVTGCASGKAPDASQVEKPGEDIVIIGEEGEETPAGITVKSIEALYGMEITGWLNEHTVILSKENTDLPKLELEDLKDFHPRSLYSYDITSQEFTLLQGQKEFNLWGSELSRDKKNLFYYEYTLGDPAYFMMPVAADGTGTLIEEAMSGEWTSDNILVGPSYKGGVYLKSPAGAVEHIEELKEMNVVHAVKIKDAILFTEITSTSLKKFDLNTREITTLPLENVYSILPSPSGTHFTAILGDGAKSTLILSDADAATKTVLAEGISISATAWSEDQRMISYYLRKDVNGASNEGLYVYDLLSGTTTLVAVDGEIQRSVFSPSGEQLSYTKFTGTGADSTILTLTVPAKK
ncbi:hypothetical protein [Proteiniclasticum ruminis]|uniref:hypothetical protein n=1 Tax=Proteiniclasticum ruminis TaxID=398199 RepID=UPI0028A9DFE8|nr:hypothetical protein [Proteiniclasticum ruminis]